MDDLSFHSAVLVQLGELVKAQHETTRSVATSMAEAVKPLMALAADIAVLKERTEHLHTPLNCPLRQDLTGLSKEMHHLEIREAWRSGAWAMIGGVVVLVGNRLWEMAFQ